MTSFNRILVVLDPSTDEQKALKRAVELAVKTGATITALMITYDFSYEMTTMLSIDERHLMRDAVLKEQQVIIDEFIEPYKEQVSQIHSEIIWHNRPYEAIVKAVLNNNYDIVIKATHEHPLLKSIIFTPTDWHLLRKCPVPLLLVKEHQWLPSSKVIAAINASSDEAEHSSLNKIIISHAIQMASMLLSEAILVNSYPGTPVSLSVEIPEFDPSSYTEAIKKHHTEAVQRYAKEFGFSEEQCIVEEGLAEDVIPLLADKLDADLVVLGTVGRTGLSAALIGNTAEQMLDSINCDVLALKPEGYVSPLAK
jgi:universal stress protein E